MPKFNRFDVMEAYLALEAEWGIGGALVERVTFKMTQRSVGVQVAHCGFAPGTLAASYSQLSPNGQEIYDLAMQRLGLDDGNGFLGAVQA